ncbi:MAG: hypothetical protein ACK417_03910 [Bacteroidia bacterium]
MHLIKSFWPALLAAFFLSLCGLFPFISWQMTGDVSGQLVYNLYRLDWFTEGSNIAASSQENRAMAWLTYGIVVLIVGMVLSGKQADLQARLLRAVVLLSGAQLFSIVVTSARATQGLQLSVLSWHMGAALWLSAAAFVLLLWQYLKKRGEDLRQ